jgi:predicted phosphate transport protein (TIGR00153 family)
MLWNLITKNPFGLVRNHMEKTLVCVQKTKDIFEAVFAGDKSRVLLLAKEISKTEHECDLLKREIRSQIAKSIFLPIDRRDLLHMLSNMDAIADSAEDVGVLLTMRWMSMPEALRPNFDVFLQRTIDVINESATVIFALDRLLEAGFSGPDADDVISRIDYIDRLEHEADKAQDQLGKKLFEHEDELSAAALVMWIKIIEKIGHISDCSERMMNHIRLMLATN